jgi:uncharacterized membrane protein YfcA
LLPKASRDVSARTAHRARSVGPQCQRTEARGDRRRAAAARAARRALEIPRIARDAEGRAVGQALDAEFRRRRLADHDGARRAQALHQHVVGGGCSIVLEDRRAVPRRHAPDVDKVFYADRHAVQRPKLVASAHGLLGRLGVASRFLRHHHAKAVEPGLGMLDGFQDALDIVDRRKLLGADEGSGLHGRHEEQIGIGHAATLSDPRHDLPRALRRAPMFSLFVLAALAVVAVVTSFISGIFGMAGGMLLIGFLLVLLPVPVAMVFHGVIQIAANSWRAWLWRHHVRWSVVLQFGAGAVTSLIVFSFFSFVPDKALVLIVMGLTPFVALAVPQRIAPDIERGGQAFLAGVIGGAMQLVSGVTGPLLDIFYVRTGMTRQVNVATKAAAQVLGHLTKVAYFAVVIEGPAGRDLEQWLVMAYAACFAVLGTTLSRSFLDRLSDRQFYYWTRRVILGLGAVYVGQGFWLMVTR